jgi:hypothetical protein
MEKKYMGKVNNKKMSDAQFIQQMIRREAKLAKAYVDNFFQSNPQVMIDIISNKFEEAALSIILANKPGKVKSINYTYNDLTALEQKYYNHIVKSLQGGDKHDMDAFQKNVKANLCTIMSEYHANLRSNSNGAEYQAEIDNYSKTAELFDKAESEASIPFIYDVPSAKPSSTLSKVGSALAGATMLAYYYGSSIYNGIKSACASVASAVTGFFSRKSNLNNEAREETTSAVTHKPRWSLKKYFPTNQKTTNEEVAADELASAGKKDAQVASDNPSSRANSADATVPSKVLTKAAKASSLLLS